MLTLHILPFCHGMNSKGETADFEGPAGLCAEPCRCLCEPFVCRCSPISSHLQSGSNGEIGHPSKGLNSYPPKGLTPKGLPLGQRTGATGLVRSGCRRCPRRTLLGHHVSAGKYYLELGQA